MGATTASVLWEHVRSADLCPGKQSLDEWLKIRWFRVRLGHVALPILPVVGYRNALILHDVHHVLTGYDTSIVGEIEIAAWEIASGGCGWNGFFWGIQLVTTLGGSVLCPRRTWRAFRAGWGKRNLYLWRADRVLGLDFAELQAIVHGQAKSA